jgi:hypothetical protein
VLDDITGLDAIALARPPAASAAHDRPRRRQQLGESARRPASGTRGDDLVAGQLVHAVGLHHLAGRDPDQPPELFDGQHGRELDERVAADERRQHRRALLRVGLRDQRVATAGDVRAEVVRATGGFVITAGKLHAGARPVDRGRALHREQRRPEEQLEGDERRDRVAGQPEHRAIAAHAERERLARLHRDLVQLELDAGRRERGAHVVAVADRHAAGRDHHVVIERARDQRRHRDRIVLRDADVRRNAAGLADHRGQSVRRRVDDLTRTRSGRDIDELVAGRDQRDARRTHDRYRRHAECRE